MGSRPSFSLGTRSLGQGHKCKNTSTVSRVAEVANGMEDTDDGQQNNRPARKRANTTAIPRFWKQLWVDGKWFSKLTSPCFQDHSTVVGKQVPCCSLPPDTQGFPGADEWEKTSPPERRTGCLCPSQDACAYSDLDCECKSLETKSRNGKGRSFKLSWEKKRKKFWLKGCSE